MESPTPIAAESTPWQPFFGFRLPFDLAELPPAHRESIHAFCSRICRSLANMSFSCQFDEKGFLLIRKNDPDPDTASVGFSPTEVYKTLHTAFSELNLSPPPPAFELTPVPAQAPASTNSHRVSLKSRLLSLFDAPKMTQRNNTDQHQRPPSSIYKQLMERFERLTRWCHEQWEAGRLIEAIHAVEPRVHR